MGVQLYGGLNNLHAAELLALAREVQRYAYPEKNNFKCCNLVRFGAYFYNFLLKKILKKCSFFIH